MSASRSLNTNKDGGLEMYVLSEEFGKPFPVCSSDIAEPQSDQVHLQATNKLS